MFMHLKTQNNFLRLIQTQPLMFLRKKLILKYLSIISMSTLRW